MTEAAGLELTIDLDALVANWRTVRRIAGTAECSAVVKADAYGIGIEAAVPALASAGCRTFFVALPEEGRRARECAPDAVIYVLAGFLPDWKDAYLHSSLRPVLNSLSSISAWAEACPGQPSAIHVDTGMNRLGLSIAEASHVASELALLERAAPALLMSHLVAADDPAHPLSAIQLRRFSEVRSLFPKIPASLANSSGIHIGADYHFDMVRPGMALYGAEFTAGLAPLTPVVTARARILQVRDAAAGETVGYGATKRLDAATRIAIVGAGYADGYHRLASGHAWAAGRRAQVLGRVSMDLIAVDVTGIPEIAEGGWVELFGRNLPVDEAARSAGTVGYEFLTQLSRRAARTYVGGRA